MKCKIPVKQNFIKEFIFIKDAVDPEPSEGWQTFIGDYLVSRHPQLTENWSAEVFNDYSYRFMDCKNLNTPEAQQLILKDVLEGKSFIADPVNISSQDQTANQLIAVFIIMDLPENFAFEGTESSEIELVPWEENDDIQ